ncbi:MAG TPA: RHS repeat-associated core domain-containing protein, partial [Gaiellaceae bacterium]|nr:RHS repeat-associated core domain-containing protein [Gaiellaceae bacterium]
MTSSSGATEWTYAYDPFGASRSTTKNDPNAPDNPMQFAGEQLDATGLYYLRAREADPATGRFETVDPITPDVGAPATSSYTYASNDPTLRTDPSGREDDP